jgi:hypothetical protein
MFEFLLAGRVHNSQLLICMGTVEASMKNSDIRNYAVGVYLRFLPCEPLVDQSVSPPVG